VIDIDLYRLVGDPAALERAGLFVAEGRLIVERLLLRGGFRVHSVAVTPTAAEALEEIFAQRPDVPVHVCEPQQLQAITGFDFHRGCLALAWRPHEIQTVDHVLQASRCLALEGVGNPDNVGGLFRTAFALGVEWVLLDRATGDPLYRKAIRTSMGATLQLPFTRLTAWGDGLATLRSHGFRILALTPHPEAIPVHEIMVGEHDRVVIVVGSEGFGLTSDAFAHADQRVRIPIDPRADSLNVVVAAGIALTSLRART
jgi:tRNA G18 (ribose-2'-O)-methylase SpoU